MAAVAVAGVMATGCKTTKQPIIHQQKETPVKNISDDITKINEILYGQWSVINVNGQGVVGDDRPYITFDAEATNPFLARIYAYNGCNMINGTVAVTADGTIKKASDYLSTLRLCPDAAYELGVSMVLDELSKYRIEKVGQEYLLYLTGGKQQSLVLRKSDIGFINGAWSVVRIGDKVIDASKGIEMVIDIPELKVHGNAGCNVINGRLVVDPDVQHSLRFTDVASTRMTCPDIELEHEFLSKLAEVVIAEPDRSPDAANLRDKEGKTVIELRRIDMSGRMEQAE